MAVERLKEPCWPREPEPPEGVRVWQRLGPLPSSCSPFDTWLAGRGLTAADLHRPYVPSTEVHCDA